MTSPAMLSTDAARILWYGFFAIWSIVGAAPRIDNLRLWS
jgi:hypothetical protein